MLHGRRGKRQDNIVKRGNLGHCRGLTPLPSRLRVGNAPIGLERLQRLETFGKHVLRHRPLPVRGQAAARHLPMNRSEEHTSELQSLMRTQYAVICLKKTNQLTKE